MRLQEKGNGGVSGIKRERKSMREREEISDWWIDMNVGIRMKNMGSSFEKTV